MPAETEIYTDGACRGNPGPGGWGAVLRHKGHEKILFGAEGVTTNNRMELMAAIRALESLTRPCRVRLTTDSQYVQKGITEWLPNWKKRGWKTSSRKPVKNVDLWQRLDAAVAGHDIRWEWVRGHSGHPENEQADALANQAIDERDAEDAEKDFSVITLTMPISANCIDMSCICLVRIVCSALFAPLR